MKIKPPSARNRRISALKQKQTHWWLIAERPKKTARLSSMNKSNKKLRALVGPSEFVKMAIKIEEDEARTHQKRN